MTRPHLPPPPHTGGCLCGGVRYVIAAPPLAINACYCDDCQKLTGSTHVLMVMAPSGDFASSGKTDRWRKRADSGREIDIVRCKTCGARVWHEPLASPEYVFVAAGTLDDTSWAIPTSHIWISRAPATAVIPPGVYTCEAQPPSRQHLIDAFRKTHSC